MVWIFVFKFSINGSQLYIGMLIDMFFVQCNVNGYVDDVIVCDFVVDVLLVFDSELFYVLCGVEYLSECVWQVIVLFDVLIVEFKGSDLLLIGVLMYNYNVLIQLKNWFDFVVWVCVMFCYMDIYLMGFVEGVCVIVFSMCGGVYVGQVMDVVMLYLCVVFGLMGIVDVEFVYVEGLDMKLYGFNVGLEYVYK